MSDVKMVSEVEAVKREREAFKAGSAWERQVVVDEHGTNAARKAAALYPLPKAKRLRAVSDMAEGVSYEWRYITGVLQFRYVNSVGTATEWRTMLGRSGDRGPDNEKPEYYGTAFKPTAARVALWADLIANPTEEVEAE